VVGDFVPLKRAGARYKGLCPFHEEKTPSFSVDPRRQLFYCFGCQAGGDVFKFLMLVENLDFPGAVRALAERAGIPVPAFGRPGRGGERDRSLLTVLEEADGFYRRALRSTAGRGAREYLARRGLSKPTVERLGIGYAPSEWETLHRHLAGKGHDPRLIEQAGLSVARRGGGGWYDRFRDRVVFPIQDLQGRTIGFGGRILGEGEPKYLNSPETPVYEKSRVLYGLAGAREAIRKQERAILVEGYLDVAALLEAGVEGAVASCGTAIGAEHAKLLARFTSRVVVNFDGDRAGRQAAGRAVDALLGCGIHPEVGVLAEGSDPDDAVRQEGADGYRKRLDEALPFVDFLLDMATAGKDLDRPGALVGALDEVLPHLARLPSAIERARYVPVVADRLGVDDEGLIAQALRRALRDGSSKIDGPVDYADLSPLLPDEAREALTEIAFRDDPPGDLDDVEACLAALRKEELEKELSRLQRDIARLQRGVPGPDDEERLAALERRLMDLGRERQALAGV
jgi:DNA primase